MVHFIDMWYTVYTLYQDYQEWWFSIAMFKYWRAFFCSKQHLWGLSLSDCQALTALLKAWWFWPKVPPLDFRLWTISLSKQILGVHWVHGFGGTNRRLWTSKIINDWDFPWSFSPKKRISEWIGGKIGESTLPGPSHQQFPFTKDSPQSPFFEGSLPRWGHRVGHLDFGTAHL